MTVVIPPAVVEAAKHAMKATGVPASVTVAQWAYESGWGKACSGTFNYFGIKAVPGQPARIVPTHEYVNGHRVLVNCAFANYETMAEGFEAHALLLAHGPRYALAMAALPDVAAFVARMAPVYATDPAYASTLMSIIHGHDLLKLDA